VVKKVAEKGVWNLRHLSMEETISVINPVTFWHLNWKLSLALCRQLRCWECGQLCVLLWSFGNSCTEVIGSQSCCCWEDRTAGMAKQAGLEWQGRI